ncbi:MAG: hypothetical protein ACFFAV_04640, partial [Candidatus Hermodarchaeota archaeon]
MKFKTKLILGIFGVLVFLVVLSAVSEASKIGNSFNINKNSENELKLNDPAIIWTDKEDYSPGETVIIYGSGFMPESLMRLVITKPDDNVDVKYFYSDASGEFVYYYELNGLEGLYDVTAKDYHGNSASTTFTDCWCTGKISGYKWEDTDGDGTWDDDELGLNDWTI